MGCQKLPVGRVEHPSVSWTQYVNIHRGVHLKMLPNDQDKRRQITYAGTDALHH